MHKRILFCILLFSFIITNIYAHYKITYSINMEKTSIGEIQIISTNTNLYAKINLDTVLLINFSQEIFTTISTNLFPTKENAITQIGDIKLISETTFNSNNISVLKINWEKTNIVNYPNYNPALSIICLLNLFFYHRIESFEIFEVFNIDNFYTLDSKRLKKNQMVITDKNNQYEILVHTREENNFLIPRKIVIRKYKVFGINWNVFNLTLKEFKQL